MADLTSTNIYGNLNVTGSGYVYGDQLYSESVISINKYSCKMVIESEGFGTGNAVDLCIPIGTSYVNFRLISLKVGHGGSSIDPEGFIEKHYSGRSYNNTLYDYVSKVVFNPVREVYAGEFSVVSGVLKVPLTHNQVNDRNLVVYLDCFGDETFINAVKEAYFSDIYVLAWPGGQYETIPERLGIGLGNAGVPKCALEISNNGVLKISGGSAPDWPTGPGLGPELAADTNYTGVGTTGISILQSYDRTALAYKDMYYNAYSHVFTTSSLSSIKMYLSNSGNLGIGKTDPAYKLDIVGDIRLTNQIISTLADGTAPFSITSTTMNTNLNADMVDGYHASDLALVPSSGTTNYLAKWTGVNSLGNSVVYDNGTNVGIGTTAPLTGVKQTIVNTTVLNSHYGQLALLDDTSMAEGVGGWLIFGGKYTDAGGYTTWSGIRGIKENSTTANYAGALAFHTRHQGSTMGPCEKLRITSTGNVGIGTNDPSKLLTVQGNNNGIRVQSTSSPSGYYFELLQNYNYSNPVSFQFYGSSGSVGEFLGIYQSGTNKYTSLGNLGNVGIGNTDPSEKLDIAGNARIREENSVKFAGTGTDDSKYEICYNSTDNSLCFNYIG